MNTQYPKRIQRLIQAAAIAAALHVTTATAQDAITAITKTADSTSSSLVVLDVRSANLGQDRIRDEVVAAIRVNFDGLKVRNHMQSHPLPSVAPRMSFSSVGDIQVPQCPGASSVVTATDRSFAGSGEGTVVQACIFPYQAGYRVNYYGYFMQRTGGANFGVLGAMLGRVITNAIGLGDSSRFIQVTADDIEKRLTGLGATVALVEMQPGREGKALVADPAMTNASGSKTQTSSMPANELSAADPRGALAAMFGGPGSQRSNSPATITQSSSPVIARKELAGMGLTYHSQDEFVAAVKRDDSIAVELFLKGQGVSVLRGDSRGLMPATAAKSEAMKQLISSYAPTK